MVESHEVLKTLREVKALLALVADRPLTKDHYVLGEVAVLVGKAPYTVREWCRQGRIRAQKQVSGRCWVVSHSEIQRYQKEGLLPLT